MDISECPVCPFTCPLISICPSKHVRHSKARNSHHIKVQLISDSQTLNFFSIPILNVLYISVTRERST